eukprot:6191503-Pleurochrysis_carterae.AAC.1
MKRALQLSRGSSAVAGATSPHIQGLCGLPLSPLMRQRERTGVVVQQSCEPLNAIFPLWVELTEGAAHHASRALYHKTQKVRIPKKCIDSLRTYCTTKCAGLLRAPAEAIAAAESGASSLFFICTKHDEQR